MRSIRWQEFALPIMLVASVLVIVAPLPAFLLDMLLAVNIAVSVIVLLTTIYVQTPLEFSVFPSLLVASTLGRLVLNLATTRLILTQAGGGDVDAAGAVIRAFGEFVAGDRIVVGIILFAIIVIIQFVVITKGATRISEVAARFALDGMPGRQMAIDADLNNGVIDEQQAQARRADLTRQADFYAAMDGASKFVRGDAIAGIIITIVNVVGGLTLGVFEYDMDIAQAASLYTKLTIGDGLASQIPAFLISIAAALLSTRSTQAVNLPTEFLAQIFSRPSALFVAAGFLGLLAFTSLPKVPLLSLGGGCVGLALMLQKRDRTAKAPTDAEDKPDKPKSQDERLQELLAVDPMELELGVHLLQLTDADRGGELLNNISVVRERIAGEIGIVMPKIRIVDNLSLPPEGYRISIASSPVATGDVAPGGLLAIDFGTAEGPLPGRQVREPAYQQLAYWIEPTHRDTAEMRGYTVVDPASALATHLQEVVRQNADMLLTRDAVKQLVDELKRSAPVLVEETLGAGIKLAQIQQVLRGLLREQVPVRQLGVILEAVGDTWGRSQDLGVVIEAVRARLARTISGRLRDSEGVLHVIMADPTLEERIAAGVELTERGPIVKMASETMRRINAGIASEAAKLSVAGRTPILCVNPRVRSRVKELTRTDLPQLTVISYTEVSADTKLESHGLVRDIG